jgi:hypothetical protein
MIQKTFLSILLLEQFRSTRPSLFLRELDQQQTHRRLLCRVLKQVFYSVKNSAGLFMRIFGIDCRKQRKDDVPITSFASQRSKNSIRASPTWRVEQLKHLCRFEYNPYRLGAIGAHHLQVRFARSPFAKLDSNFAIEFTCSRNVPLRLILYWNQFHSSGSSCIGKEWTFQSAIRTAMMWARHCRDYAREITILLTVIGWCIDRSSEAFKKCG